MTEAKKMLISHRSHGKHILNIPLISTEAGLAYVEHDTFVAQLADRLRMLSDESRLNAMLEILAILNQFTRTDANQ